MDPLFIWALSWFLSRFCHLLDILAELWCVEAPPKEGNWFLIFSDIPKSLSVIPDFKEKFCWVLLWHILPGLIGTFPHLIPDLLQVTKGHMEVALVFVDVLQGFGIFVHKTEIWMDNNHSQEQIKKAGITWLPLIKWSGGMFLLTVPPGG